MVAIQCSCKQVYIGTLTQENMLLCNFCAEVFLREVYDKFNQLKDPIITFITTHD